MPTVSNNRKAKSAKACYVEQVYPETDFQDPHENWELPP